VTKLHQVLPKREQVKPNQAIILNETIKMVSSASGLTRSKTTFYPNEEGQEPRIEQEDSMTTTVEDRLRYTLEQMTSFQNLELQIADANSRAKADLIVDGVVLAKDLPATFLLTLRKTLTNLKGVISRISTLDNGCRWVIDTQNNEGFEGNVFRHDALPVNRTRKLQEFRTVVAPTENHPAQVAEVVTDKVIGEIKKITWSGQITSAQKGELINRVIDLIGATSEAIARANEVEVNNDLSCFDGVSNYILGGFGK
jgi:hypothetical protein